MERFWGNAFDNIDDNTAVFGDELVLKVDGMCGDNDFFIVGYSPEGSGNKIGEGFSRTCACFSDENAFVVYGIDDFGDEGDLFLSAFKG